MIYPIVLYGDPVLKKKARPIEKDELDVKELAENMFETMYGAQGVGLAAPQIGKSLRMFVVDSGELEDDEDETKGFKQVFINPEMIDEDGKEWTFEEGCLSIPKIREEVNRKGKIRLRFLDENWEEHEEDFDGIRARIIQHEYDHIEGVLFTDRLSSLKKRLLKGKLSDISKGKVDTDYRIKAPSK